MSLPIPVVDFAEAFSSDARARRSAAHAVRAAGQSSGMFLIANHGVPAALVAAHFAYARAFFDLDPIEKRAIDVTRSNCFRGYEAFGTQTIDPAAPGDLKEGFIMGPHLPPDHPHVLARYPNTGANLWPRRPDGFRPHMESWIDAMNALGRRTAAVLARSLDLSETYFAAGLTEPLTYSQLLHYPPVRAAAGMNRFGAGAHVDWGLLTLLLQDDVGGLEVRAADGSWEPVAPVPGTITVILGELTVRLTDGVYRSAIHRVAKNTGCRGRYSMPTFFDPAYEHEIACVPTCRSDRGESRYASCTVAQHMQAMARGTLTVTAAMES